MQENNHFIVDLDGYLVTTNFAWESPGVARHTAGSVVPLTSDITLVDAIEYEVTFTAGGSTAGTVTPYAGSGAAGTARGNGTFTERLTCTTSTDFLLTPTTDFDGWVDNVYVRVVDPLINWNKKYYFKDHLVLYNRTLTNPEDAKVLASIGIIRIEVIDSLEMKDNLELI